MVTIFKKILLVCSLVIGGVSSTYAAHTPDVKTELPNLSFYYGMNMAPFYHFPLMIGQSVQVARKEGLRQGLSHLRTMFLTCCRGTKNQDIIEASVGLLLQQMLVTELAFLVITHQALDPNQTMLQKPLISIPLAWLYANTVLGAIKIFKLLPTFQKWAFKIKNSLTHMKDELKEYKPQTEVAKKHLEEARKHAKIMEQLVAKEKKKKKLSTEDALQLGISSQAYKQAMENATAAAKQTLNSAKETLGNINTDMKRLKKFNIKILQV